MAKNDYTAEDLVAMATDEVAPEEAIAEPVQEVGAEADIVVADAGTLARPVTELSFAEKVKLARAASNFESIWEHLKAEKQLEIDVVDIISLDAEVTDRQTGEIMGKRRNTFLTADGVSWSTTSDAVNSIVAIIHGIFGASSTWEQPLHLTFTKSESCNGNQFVNVIF